MELLKHNFRAFPILISDVLFCLTLVGFHWLFALFGCILLLGLVLTQSFEDDFYCYITLIPFSDGVIIYKYNFLPLFLFLSILKAIVVNRRSLISRMNLLILTLLGLILLTEITYDLQFSGIGIFVTIVSYLVYYSVYCMYANTEKLSRKKLAFYLISSFCIALIATFILSGGLQALLTASADNRFGELVRELGGAMGIPVYCLLTISILMYYVYHEKKILHIVLLLVLIVSVGILGFFTLSKLYLFGLGVIGIFLIISLFNKVYRKKSLIFLGCLVICAIAILFVYPELYYDKIYTMIVRLLSNFTTGRDKIYLSCLQYLMENPLVLIFGLGASNYVEVGVSGGYAFEMMAHNILLDGLMSWGILGLSAFIFITVIFVRKSFFKHQAKLNLWGVLPFIVWFCCRMTAGTFNYFIEYVYILIVTQFCFIGDHKLKANET